MLAMKPVSFETIAARRRARIAFGWPLIAGAAAMVANGLSRHMHFAWILLASWSLALVAGAVARVFPSRRMPAAAPSLAIPMIGLCLVLPLTLHFEVGALIGWSAKEFDEWVDLSLVVTGPAHLAIAGLCAYRARELTTPPLVAIRTLTIYGYTIGVSCIPFGFVDDPTWARRGHRPGARPVHQRDADGRRARARPGRRPHAARGRFGVRLPA